MAVFHRRQEMVRLLLAAGADTELTNQEGQTAAILARENGFPEIAESLKP